MRYEVDAKNVVRIYQDGEDAPFVEQPTWPNGKKWASAEEATSWAQIFVDGAEGRSNLVPPNGPNEQPVEMPIPPKPFESWVWNEQDRAWIPPFPAPVDQNRYGWNEELGDWEKLPTFAELLKVE